MSKVKIAIVLTAAVVLAAGCAIASLIFWPPLGAALRGNTLNDEGHLEYVLGSDFFFDDDGGNWIEPSLSYEDYRWPEQYLPTKEGREAPGMISTLPSSLSDRHVSNIRSLFAGKRSKPSKVFWYARINFEDTRFLVGVAQGKPVARFLDDYYELSGDPESMLRTRFIACLNKVGTRSMH